MISSSNRWLSVAIGWRFGGGVEMTDKSREPINENCSVRGIRGGRHRQRVDVGFQVAQFLFGRYAEFLFFVDNQQAQILEFDAFAEQFVRSDQNVDLAGGQVVGDLPHLFRAFTRLRCSIRTGNSFNRSLNVR